MSVKMYINAVVLLKNCYLCHLLLTLALEHRCHWYLLTLFLFSAHLQLHEKIKLKMCYYSSCTSNPGIWIKGKKFYFGIQKIPNQKLITFKPQLSQDSIRGEMQTSAPCILKIQRSNPIRIAYSVIRMIAFKILPSIERGLTKPLFFFCPFTMQPQSSEDKHFL